MQSNGKDKRQWKEDSPDRIFFPNNKVTSWAPIEQLRMGTGGVCVRQDNTQEWQSVIEISINEVISGVIAEVLWLVFVYVREGEGERRLNVKTKNGIV